MGWSNTGEFLTVSAGCAPDGGSEVSGSGGRGNLVHLRGGDEIGVLPLEWIGVGLLVGKGRGVSWGWRCGGGLGTACGGGGSGCGGEWSGGGKSRGEDNRVELGLSRGVGRKRVGLDGGRPGFWLWSGLLLLVHE